MILYNERKQPLIHVKGLNFESHLAQVRCLLVVSIMMALLVDGQLIRYIACFVPNRTLNSFAISKSANRT